MKKYCLLIAAWFITSGTPILAQKDASVQATPVPFNMALIGKVKQSGSDTRSADFNRVWLPKFNAIVEDNLSESVVFTNASGFKLDSSKLFLRMQAKQTIRVYFISEGAGYQNSVGFAFTPAGSPTPGTPKMMYPNASMGTGSRTVDAPLRAGDFVELGLGGNGWQLDFFLIGDAFRLWKAGNRTSSSFVWYWNDQEKNGDGIQHVVAFAMPDSPYILIGFEDLYGGGDRDYNDALFVVDIGMENVVSLIDDPSTLPQ